MRKLIMLSAFVLAAGFATAQEATATTAKKACTKSSKSCAKTCTKAQKAACAKTCTKAQKAACASKSASTAAVEGVEGIVLSAEAQAVIAAEKDENIERKECAHSGKVSYYQKSVCAKSGKVAMNEVKYCTDAQAFVNASPSEVMSENAEAKVIKTADTVDGKVQSTTKNAKKKCCKGKKKCGSKKVGA